MDVLFILSFSSSEQPDIEIKKNDIESAYKIWKSHDLKNYTIKETIENYCFNGGMQCEVSVKNNQIDSISESKSGSLLGKMYWSNFKTIDGIFDWLKTIEKEQIAILDIEFDSKFGYPKNIFVDFESGIADEEMGYSLTDLQINSTTSGR